MTDVGRKMAPWNGVLREQVQGPGHGRGEDGAGSDRNHQEEQAVGPAIRTSISCFSRGRV